MVGVEKDVALSLGFDFGADDVLQCVARCVIMCVERKMIVFFEYIRRNSNGSFI